MIQLTESDIENAGFEWFSGLGCAVAQGPGISPDRPTPSAHDGSPKRFHELSLAQLIDVACEVDVLNLDIKQRSYSLRDFRNYINRKEQKASGFTPDEHTAKVCFQVLKAELVSITGDRQ